MKIVPALLAFCLVQTAFAVDIQRWHNRDGSTVTLVERHELPIVNISVVFKGAGQAADAPTDVAAYTAELLAYGSKQEDEETLRDASNRLGITLASSASTENAAVSLASPSRKETLQPALGLLNRIIVQPAFDEAVFKRVQSQGITSLKQSESNPSFVALRAAGLLNYRQHPYANGERSSEASIRALTPAALADFHRRHYAKDNAYVAIVGDVSRNEAEKIAETVLAGLPEHSSVRKDIPPVGQNAGEKQQIAFADKEQAVVVMSMPLMVRQDPDRFALAVGNYILGGGGFDSRLMNTLRDREGLVYGVSSSLSALTRPGPFTVMFSTKKDEAGRASAAARKVLADFTAEGPTEAELRQAKDNIIGSFPMNFDTNAKMLPYAARAGVDNLPLDYLDTYPQKIEAVSAEEVKAVWQRRLQLERLNEVVVGGQ